MYRAASGLGLFRSVFVIALIIFLMVALYTFILQAEARVWISAGYLASILIIHSKRPDKQFLNVSYNYYRLIFIFEYLLLAIPLLVCLLYFQSFELASITLLGLCAIPFLGFSFQKKGINNRIIRAIPEDAFEWKSGIRKFFVFGMIVWSTGLITAGYVGSVPVTIFLLSLIIVNFYDSGEPVTILIGSELNPKRFLFRKLLIGQSILSFILLPLVLAFIIFHPALWYIPVVEYVLISFILWYAIFIKYAFYIPNQPLIAGQIFTAIGAISLFLPFLIPLVWILSVRFYYKSIANLNPYLDDFN